jgi:hypothetical protein
MGRKADARTVLFERIRSSPAKFVHVVGVPYAVEAEQDLIDAEKNDHVWITVEAPPFGRLRCAVNTLSRLNRDAGFDPRVRVAIMTTNWTERPPTTLEEVNGLDYSALDVQLGLTYEFYEHQPLTDLLIERAKSAVRAEVWGELYAGETLGVHQIHSRAASCAVKVDLKGRDGALKLYYAKDNLAEMFFFKFCGQP